MPDQYDLNTVRWKMADELDPGEVEFLQANQDKLNDEEKVAFRDVLEAAQPFADNPDDVVDNAINNAVDAEDKTTPPADAQPANPAQPTPPPPTPTVPQTQEQLDAYLEQKRKTWEAEGKSAQEQQDEESKIQQFFDAGYTPKDWNEYTNEMFNKIAPVIEQRVIKHLEEQNKRNAEEVAKIQQTREQVLQRFEQEYDTLSENGLIPKRDDPQYKEVHDAIWKIGDANGKNNITDAYKLWSVIPVEHGGGLVVDGTTKPTDPNEQINKQKQQAARIGSGRGTVGAKKGGAPQWSNVHSISMDDALDAAKAKHGLPV